MKESMKKLLDKFPYFLNKDKSSNFYKSEKVFNEWFGMVDNDLFQTYMSEYIRKPMLIWKEQTKPYEYKIHFLVIVDNLESVTLYKNDEVIYTKSYEISEDNRAFYFAYNDESLNIIPDDTFTVKVYTGDEYTLEKAYPTDIDETLDHVGELNGIPRKKYSIVDASEYPYTEPPYNDQTIEDDFHYMNRILTYNLLYHVVPLPLLKIWSMYGIAGTIVNRQNSIARMSSESRGEEWTPRSWEHKDCMCSGTVSEKEMFFFATVDNNRPVRGQTIHFDFNVIDSYGRQLDDDFVFIVYKNNELVTGPDGEPVTIHGRTWSINTKDLEDSAFIFKLYSNAEIAKEAIQYDGGLLNVVDGDIVSKPIIITIYGCDEANYHVSVTGNDSNVGTKDNPLKTIECALSKVTAEENIINIMGGNYNLTSPITIHENTVLMSCAKNPPVINCSNHKVFTVKSGVWLDLINLKFKSNCCYNTAVNTRFTNDSSVGIDFNMDIDYNYACKIWNAIFVDYTPVRVDKPVAFTVTLKDKEDDLINAESLKIIFNNETNTITTNTTGYTYNKTVDVGGVYPLTVIHEESEEYCESELETKLLITHLNELLTDDNGSMSYRTDHAELLFSIDDEGNWNYTHNENTVISINEDGDISVEENYDL